MEVLLGVTPKGCKAEETQREGFSQENESVFVQREESGDGSWFLVGGCGLAGIRVCMEFKGMKDKDEVFQNRAGSDVFLEDAASTRVSERFPYPEQDVRSHHRWQTRQNSIRCDL